jgi:hypothetical protein
MQGLTAAFMALAWCVPGNGSRRALTGGAILAFSSLALDRALTLRGTVAPSFLAVHVALTVCGLVLVAIASALAWQSGARLAAGLLSALALALSAHPLVWRSLAPSAVLVGLGTGAVFHGLLALVPTRGPQPAPRHDERPWWLGPALAGLVVAGPHLLLVAMGTVGLVAWRRHWVRAALVAALLGGWLWAARAIAGPVGLGMATLGEVPFSPYAAVPFSAALLVIILAVAGVFPLGSGQGGALLAPVAAALTLRVLLPALPDGLEHWRSLVDAWLVVAAVVAAVRGHPAALLAALGLFVILTGEGTAARVSGGLLTVMASCSEMLTGRDVAELLAPALAAVAAAALVIGLAATLEVEVVYTTLMAAVLALAPLWLPQWRANWLVRPLASNATTS